MCNDWNVCLKSKFIWRFKNISRSKLSSLRQKARVCIRRKFTFSCMATLGRIIKHKKGRPRSKKTLVLSTAHSGFCKFVFSHCLLKRIVCLPRFDMRKFVLFFKHELRLQYDIHCPCAELTAREREYT